MKVFSGYRLDTVSHCLWRGEERVSLAPKAFDVLRYLVEHAERLVTQDEILEALWPGTYVNPEVIKKYILGIRKVLGDHSGTPEFVATHPRRGYQFIASVREEPRVAASALCLKSTKSIVGRDSALGNLQAALSQAMGGERQVVFVTGEAGIGKTTLVDFFLQQASQSEEVRIARGQCVEGFGGKEAYYPVLEALGQLLADADDSLLSEFSKRAPTWLVQLPSLVNAELREALEKEIVGTTRERMVREICEALEAISMQYPLILCMEDLHWVDPSTLDFVSALARRRGSAKLLLLGTYRPADVIISQSPLKALKQDLVIHDLGREISLERLEEAHVAEYVALQFREADFPAGFSPLVHQHSGGNALFMTTILRDMKEKDLIRQINNTWKLTLPLEKIALSVPDTLDQLIEGHFRQLTADEQRVLRSASVAGENFSVWAIAGAADIDAGNVEEICEGLASKLQFLKFMGIQEQANGQISAHYEFLHSIYREVVYRRLSDSQRSRLHLALAQRLKVFCDPCEQEMATELALHFEGGRDYSQAVHYLILAAENAASRFAYRDSIEILQHALELVAKLTPAFQPQMEFRVLKLIGDAQFALGALEKSAQTYLDAASRAGQAGLKAAEVRALADAMGPFGYVAPDQGIAAIDRAVEMSKGMNDPALLARSEMLAAGSRLIFDTWTAEDADLCLSAHETLRRLGDSDTSLFQHMVYAHVLTLRGNYHEALEICGSRESRMDRSSCLMTHFRAVSVTTLALLRMGRFGEVLQITRSRELPDNNRALYWLLSFREAWLRILLFDFGGAQQICENMDGIRAGVDLPDGQPRTIREISAGCAALARQDYDEAIQRFGRVRNPKDPAKFFLHWIWRMTAELETANVWLASGHIPKALAEADGFLDSAMSTADPHLQALAWELKARIALAENNLEGARYFIVEALAIVAQYEILVAAWQVYATAWQLYEKAREYEAAEVHLQRAQTCISRISDSLAAHESLRSTFLAAPPVRALVETSRRASATVS